MWINKERKVAYIAHPRTASRETAYEVLKYRGFCRFMGHHGIPWSADYPRPKNFEEKGEVHWWYTQNPMEWTWWATHRNHYEVFHSITYAALGGHPPSPGRFDKYLWRHPALYRNRGILFPAFVEINGCKEIRFDHLREDVDAMLRFHDLRPLRDSELVRDGSIHHTSGKPRKEHYSMKLDPLSRRWIDEHYGPEIARFGYGWHDIRKEKRPATGAAGRSA